MAVRSSSRVVGTGPQPGHAGRRLGHIARFSAILASVQGLFVIRLEAQSPATRLPRVYQLSVDRDLFGTWVVDIAFGRRGRRGRVMRVLAETEQAACCING